MKKLYVILAWSVAAVSLFCLVTGWMDGTLRPDQAGFFIFLAGLFLFAALRAGRRERLKGVPFQGGPEE